MQALVIYDSKFGHTEQLAKAIGEVLATKYASRVAPVAEAGPLAGAGVDLLVVGGPTHAHGMSAPMRELLAGIERGSLAGVAAAAFDTRFQMARWLSGSAAGAIARRLRHAGCRPVAPPESFFVARTENNPLLPGELERATDWAKTLLAAGRQAEARPLAKS